MSDDDAELLADDAVRRALAAIVRRADAEAPLCPACGVRPQEVVSTGVCLPCHDQAELAKQRKRSWWQQNGQAWRQRKYGNGHGKPPDVAPSSEVPHATADDAPSDEAHGSSSAERDE